MYPELHLGPLTLQSFGLMFALAFLAAGWLIWKRLREIGEPVDWAYEIGFSALLGGVVGSRLYFIVQNYDDVKGDLLGNLLGGSGLVWYGGAIGGALAVFAWAATATSSASPCSTWRRRRWRWATRSGGSAASSPATATTAGPGTGLGRWPIPTAPSPPTQRVHPTPVYETLAMGLGAWILWQLRDRYRAGVLFAIYLVYAGAERFLVEFIRRNTDVALGLTSAQLESLAMMLLGIGWLLVVR